MELHKIKKLLHKKRMVSKLRRTSTEWEKIYIRQRTDNQNIQGAQKTKLPQNQ
jgi:hypothetical protein